MRLKPGIPFAHIFPAIWQLSGSFLRSSLIIALLIFSPIGTTQPLTPIAGTGSTYPNQENQLTISPDASPHDLPSLKEFITTVSNGDETVVVGVYVPGVFALPVVQQPDGDFGYVSMKPEALTQFQLADENHVIGLLAHNYLSGRFFYKLIEGQRIVIVKGDGSHRTYQVSDAYRFKKLDPDSNTSKYIDLSTGKELSTRQVFNRFYRVGAPHVTFQTCLEQDGDLVWGLLFVVAIPLDLPQ